MKVTTHDIARVAGVSQSMVSIVLNNNTKVSISPETRALVLNLKKYPQCTAIIAVNDMTAMGCISVLHQKGIRIPEDMAICGFYNLYLDSMMQPPLTSIDQMAFHGCKVGLGILQEKMKSFSLDEEAVYMEYKPRLYVRGTTVKK